MVSEGVFFMGGLGRSESGVANEEEEVEGPGLEQAIASMARRAGVER